MRKDYIINLIKKYFPQNSSREQMELRLKDIVWRNRSGINYKKTVSTKEPFDWLKFANEKPYHYEVEWEEVYKYIYSQIDKEVDNISNWFISKKEF